MADIAPSPVTFVAVPKLSCAIYKAIIKPMAASLNPKIEPKIPLAAMTDPPGTPGASIMIMPNMNINTIIVGTLTNDKLGNTIIAATEQLTSVIVEPDK